MRKKFRIRKKNLLLHPVPPAAAEKMLEFRQGDWLQELKGIPIATGNGIGSVYAKNGVIVISQTCDLVQSTRLSVQVVPLVYLSEPQASEARDGARPRYVHIPNLGSLAFADLEIVGTLSKEYVAKHARRPGVGNPTDTGILGRAIGRRFSRYPFPDSVTPWLQPLEKLAKSKSQKVSTPEHDFFESVVQLRLESTNGWGEQDSYELTLIVIVKPETLPMFPNDEIPEMDSALRAELFRANGDIGMTSTQIATRLKAYTNESEKYWLWQALGVAWAETCRPPTGTSQKVLDAVAGGKILCEVVESNLYTLDRWLRSEMLDLDHLSKPDEAAH